MQISPQNVTLLGQQLDHPESLCIAGDGTIYCGGEAGQVYRIRPDGQQSLLAQTGGFLLGLALDGHQGIHACDMGRQVVVHVDAAGQIRERSRGTPQRTLAVPNHPVFDALGNLYVSDSGDYWNPQGSGCIFVVRSDDTTELFHAGPFAFANGLALHPTGQWLYLAQTTAHNIVRVPLDRPNGAVTVAYTLPPDVLPDGLSFTADHELLIGCYKPDAVWIGHADGRAEPLLEDPTGELLNRPTNVALHGGRLVMSNLGGWQLTAVATNLAPGLIHYPTLRTTDSPSDR